MNASVYSPLSRPTECPASTGNSCNLPRPPTLTVTLYCTPRLPAPTPSTNAQTGRSTGSAHGACTRLSPTAHLPTHNTKYNPAKPGRTDDGKGEEDVLVHPSGCDSAVACEEGRYANLPTFSCNVPLIERSYILVAQNIRNIYVRVSRPPCRRSAPFQRMGIWYIPTTVREGVLLSVRSFLCAGV